MTFSPYISDADVATPPPGKIETLTANHAEPVYRSCRNQNYQILPQKFDTKTLNLSVAASGQNVRLLVIAEEEFAKIAIGKPFFAAIESSACGRGTSSFCNPLGQPLSSGFLNNAYATSCDLKQREHIERVGTKAEIQTYLNSKARKP